jgi:hypothetical protein
MNQSITGSVLRLRGGGLVNVVKDSSNKILINSSIHLESFHLSHCSDLFSPGSSYFGLVIYEECVLNNHRIHPGYVFIKQYLTVGGHGGLIDHFLSSGYYPFPQLSEGFAYVHGQLRFNSSTFNTNEKPSVPSNPATAYNVSRQMNYVTMNLLDAFLRKVWISGYFPLVNTLSIEQIEDSSFTLSNNICYEKVLVNPSSHNDCVIHTCAGRNLPIVSTLPASAIPIPPPNVASNPLIAGASTNVKKRKRRSHLPWTRKKQRKPKPVISKHKVIRKRRGYPCWTHKKKSKHN